MLALDQGRNVELVDLLAIPEPQTAPNDTLVRDSWTVPIGVLLGKMTMNEAFGWVALGLWVSIMGATYLLRAAAQSVKLAILNYAHLAVQPPADGDDF